MAKIFDLGTGLTTGGIAFATIGQGPALVVLVTGHLCSDEVADEAGEGLWHLIGKRHHAS